MFVKKGDKVKVSYTGTLTDGTVFDKSKDNTPLEFIVGNGQVIPGFDRAIQGMQINEEKKITIKAEDAFGKREETLTKQFPRTFFPEDFKPEKGMTVGLKGNDGQSIPARITEITEESITIDLNHPLAGEDLTFDIKVVGIE
jgi:peptidylprolyl isomerase